MSPIWSKAAAHRAIPEWQSRIPPLQALSTSAGKVALPSRTDQSRRSEEHTSELQSLMRISYAVFCLKKKNKQIIIYKTLRTLYMKQRNQPYKITRCLQTTHDHCTSTNT